MSCTCAACRGAKKVWKPSEAWLDRFNADVRASLGKPALPVMDDLPADVRAFVETM